MLYLQADTQSRRSQIYHALLGRDMILLIHSMQDSDPGRWGQEEEEEETGVTSFQGSTLSADLMEEVSTQDVSCDGVDIYH